MEVLSLELVVFLLVRFVKEIIYLKNIFKYLKIFVNY